jgi:hypothetical protein
MKQHSLGRLLTVKSRSSANKGQVLAICGLPRDAVKLGHTVLQSADGCKI